MFSFFLDLNIHKNNENLLKGWKINKKLENN